MRKEMRVHIQCEIKEGNRCQPKSASKYQLIKKRRQVAHLRLMLYEMHRLEVSIEFEVKKYINTKAHCFTFNIWFLYANAILASANSLQPINRQNEASKNLWLKYVTK